MAGSGTFSLPAIQANSEHSGTLSLTTSPTVSKSPTDFPDDSLSKNGPIDFRFRSKVFAWVVLHSIYSKQAMAEHEEIYAALEARRQEQRIAIAIQKHLKNAEDRLDMFYNRQRTQARLGYLTPAPFTQRYYLNQVPRLSTHLRMCGK